MKRKRGTSHYRHPIRIRTYKTVDLPDGHCYAVMARGWLDADGIFYEVPEGKVLKVQDLNETGPFLYAYAPEHLVKKGSIQFTFR